MFLYLIIYIELYIIIIIYNYRERVIYIYLFLCQCILRTHPQLQGQFTHNGDSLLGSFHRKISGFQNRPTVENSRGM